MQRASLVLDVEGVAAVRALFEEYAGSLAFDLSYQQFAEELASLPGKYAPPRGALLLARVDSEPAGCIALRPLSEMEGELKRLYVPPRFRGLGLARALIDKAVATAREIGYKELVLDTHESMQAAMALYTAYGFQPTAPYWPNPHPGILFFRLVLTPQDAAT